MKFVKENLTVLICATVALLLVVAAFVYPIPGMITTLKADMTEDLGKEKVVQQYIGTTLQLPGLPEKKGVPSDKYIAAKVAANAAIDGQKKKVEDAGRIANSRGRLSDRKAPLLFVPTAADPNAMVEEPNLLPKSQGGDALKYKADYINQFRIWTGWLTKGTPQDSELNATMPPDASEMKTDWDTKEQALQVLRGAGSPPPDPNKFNDHMRQQVMAKASDLRMYVDQFAFQRRSFAATDNPPTEDEIFTSLFDSWLQADVVKSIAAINAQANGPTERSVAKSPVKRLSRIVIGNGARTRFLTGGANMNQQSPLMTPVLEVGPLFLTPGNAILGLGGQTLVVPGAGTGDTAPPNTIEYNYGMSGRAGGAEYDIVLMTILLDIDPVKLNAFVDQLYQKNMGYTVSSIQMKTVDPLERASTGYLYGDSQVVEAEIMVECLFFRSWTVPLMTERVRMELGQPALKPANP